MAKDDAFKSSFINRQVDHESRCILMSAAAELACDFGDIDGVGGAQADLGLLGAELFQQRADADAFDRERIVDEPFSIAGGDAVFLQITLTQEQHAERVIET